jgi:uncharacterized membrane protein YdbT with pleckstrin-like domain
MMWRKLSEKVKLIWLLNEWAPAIIALILYYFFLVPFFVQIVKIKMDLYTTIITGLFIIYLAIKFIYIELKYRHFRYGLGENELLIEEGIIEKRYHTIPYEKIQNVSVVYEIPHRLLNVGKIIITTAAGAPGLGEYILDGIENPDEIARAVAKRVEIAKGIKPKEDIIKEKEIVENEYNKLVEKIDENLLTLAEKINEIEEKISNIPVEELKGTIEELELRIESLEKEIEELKKKKTKKTKTSKRKKK